MEGFFIDSKTNKNQISNTAKILNNVFIENSVICGGAIIYPNSVIINSFIGENAVVKSSYIEKSKVCENVEIGPFSHIKQNSVIGKNSTIGNFVEVKNSVIGENVKAKHHSYIGDAEVGKNTNIGCGVIFANYNGKIKSKIIIEKNCFIGCNSNLIAPLVVAENTYISAGTTLTKNTNSGDFVIGRSRETIKPNKGFDYLK